jgi:hypothetical protein
MTEILVCSFLVGAATGYRLLRWGLKNEAKLDEVKYELSARMLAPLLLVVILSLGLLYSTGYASLILLLASLITLLVAAATERIQGDRRCGFSTVLVHAAGAEVRDERKSKWFIAFNSFMLVVVLGVLFAEFALDDSPHNGLALRSPGVYAFIGEERAVPLLVVAAIDDDIRTARSAALSLIELDRTEELVQMGGLAAPALASLLDYDKDREVYDHIFYGQPSLNNGRVRGEAAGALAEIGRPAMPALLGALNNDNYYARWLAAEAIIRIDDPGIIQSLRNANHRHYETGRCPICYALETK